jgi:hypothetical protein
MTAKFQNGDIVKDTVTGYKGMIVATTLWLNGCYRYVVQSQKLDKDGKPHDPPAFDEHQLELVKSMFAKGKHDTGGPRPAVSQAKLPR